MPESPHWKAFFILLAISPFAFIGTVIEWDIWYIAALPSASGLLGWLGQTIGIRNGWMVRCEWPPNAYRPKSMLVTVIAAIVAVGGLIFLTVYALA